MTRIVPFDPTYALIHKLEKSAFILLMISAIIITANWAIGQYGGFLKLNHLYIFQEIGKVISYVSIIAYLVITLITRILFHTVEKKKRNDLIDNSFGTKYSDENTVGYYNNEETGNGIRKLALNSYESSFHTENTLKIMIHRNLLLLIVISIPFFLSIFSKGGENFVRLLFEISIPLILVSEFVVLLTYYINVTVINERFKTELISIDSNNFDEKDIPRLLIPIMEYYSIKSWANTNLDSKIFNEHNTIISRKWATRKASFEK